MTDAEIAWVAGLLEGEGSFLICYSRCKDRRYAYARISIQMADRDVIEHLAGVTAARAKIFTDKIRWTEKVHASKPLHRLWIDGTAAVNLMLQLRPWMGERRKGQIDLAIAAHRQSAPSEEQKRAQRLSAAAIAWAATAKLSQEERREKMRKVAESRWGKARLSEEAEGIA